MKGKRARRETLVKIRLQARLPVVHVRPLMEKCAPYDLIAEQWNSLRTGFRSGEESYLQLLLDSLSPNSRILDLGCGTGTPNATFLSAAGHRIHGIDASEKLLEIARENLPDATLEAGQLEGDQPLPGPFDSALCWDALFHLERALHQKVFERVAASLRPGALFLLTSGGSANDPFTDTMWDVEFSYDAHPPAETERLLTASGFEIIRSSLLEEPTGGRNKGRLAVAARKVTPRAS
ncbi:MAG: class I SAM-dependent methyltransferase [Verrucomicrobiota bacterium]